MKRHFSTHLMTILMLVALCIVPATTFAAGPGPAHEVRFTGVIDVLPAAEGAPWQIAGQTVNVNATTTVRLTDGPAVVGMWAAVIAQRDAEGALVASQIVVMAPEIRLKGPITTIPDAAGRVGTWVVAGQDIQVTDETRFNERGGKLAVGGWAEVYALEVTGALTALRIRSTDFQEEVEVYGVIQSFLNDVWTLSTIELTVTDATLITGEPQVGLLAHAAAALRDDESLLARTIRVMWLEPGRRHEAVQLRGVVESLPAEGLIGDWVVSGREVQVTEATIIKQVKGLVEPGAEVHVVGWEAEGAIQAVQVTVIAQSWRGRAFNYAGPVEELPRNGVVGYWNVAGNRVQVTQQTRMTGGEFARLGAPAEVGGVQLQNGVRVATWLRIRESDGPGPGPTATPAP